MLLWTAAFPCAPHLPGSPLYHTRTEPELLLKDYAERSGMPRYEYYVEIKLA